MKRLSVNPRCVWIVALLVCLVCAGAANVARAAGSKPGGNVAQESLRAFDTQLAAGEVKSAALKRAKHLLHVKLKDGRHLTVPYTGSAGRLRGELRAHGVSVAKAKKAPAHKTRYIVGGAVVVVLIIALVGLLVWRRRRRAALDEY